MVGVTGGEMRGQVTAPDSAARRTSASSASTGSSDADLRVRLTGSMYKTDRSASNTLNSGDRAGSRYYDVLENTASTETANAWSGAIQSRDAATWSRRSSVNPFVKFGGVEFFGNIETMTGAAPTEPQRRTLRQLRRARGCIASRTTSSTSAAATTR